MQRFYESRKAWFDKLPERKYIITEFLPSCKERVLNVGLDDFNANEEVCCNSDCLYETIDIRDEAKIYGSSFKHTTIDYLHYNPEYKFDNIILFGVLGLPDGHGGGCPYTLYNNETKMIEHTIKILNKGGNVLLGPDITCISNVRVNNYSTQEYWEKFIDNNDLIKQNFEIIKCFKGRNNMIIVLKKII